MPDGVANQGSGGGYNYSPVVNTKGGGYSTPTGASAYAPFGWRYHEWKTCSVPPYVSSAKYITTEMCSLLNLNAKECARLKSTPEVLARDPCVLMRVS